MRFLQINLGKGKEAQDLLLQTAIEKEIDLLLICEQYRKPETKIWYQDQTEKTAIMITNKCIQIKEVTEDHNSFIWMEISDLRIYSCYLSPNATYDSFLKNLDELENSMRTAKGKILVAGDFNSKSPEWGSDRLDKRGITVSEMIVRHNMVACNEGLVHTFRRGNSGSVVDITFASMGIGTCGWRVKEDITLSDHQYIMYDIDFQEKRKGKESNIYGSNIYNLEGGRSKNWMRR